MKCGRCTLSLKEGEGGEHGLGMCPLEPLHSPLRFPVKQKGIRRDPEEIIKEVGAEKLSKTAAGRVVLENARSKYRAELLQPHEPEFNKYWGKTVERRNKEMAEVRAESQRMKREAV